MITINHYINGQNTPPSAGTYLETSEPATGAVYARVAEASAADVEQAVMSAQRAFPAWQALSFAQRGEYLLRLADIIDAECELLAMAESRDTGKPVSMARSVDIPRSAANLRYFANAVQHSSGECFDFDGAGTPNGQRSINYTLRTPRGVAACISPWNLPLYLLTWKIAPALATGNTVVAKPSEVTPMTAGLLGELCTRAGLPGGVLNILHGTGANAGAPLVLHRQVPTVTFTGSTSVGRWIGQHAGAMLKRVSLELGGKNPFIVFPETNVKAAAELAVRAAFSNQGQICLCGSRLLLHERIAEEFIEHFLVGASRLVIGDPSDNATQFGSLVSAAHLAKVDGYVRAARAKGCRVLLGGQPIPSASLPRRCAAGSFFPPTVLDGLDGDSPAVCEEIFGPVVTIQRFASTQEALELANATNYGLAAVVMCDDLATVQRVTRGIAAGVVWVNCWMVRDLRTPFGGARASGVGREGGAEALRFFTEPKNVCLLG